MTIYDKIRYEKLKYVINKEAAKISALSSLKIDKYEYLTGEEILARGESRITEQAKFTYSALAKATETHKSNWRSRNKRSWGFKSFKPEENQELNSIEGLFPKKVRNNEIKTEIDEIKKWEDKIQQKDFK